MDLRTMKPTLVIMTKEVVPGNVKTRLASSIGNTNAAKIHFELFRYLLEQIQILDIPVVVSLDQIIAHGEIQELCNEYQIPTSIQVTGDLGMKICYEMNRYSRCTVIGSDTPLISLEEIKRTLLSTQDLFLGPSEDGGYWLISMKKPNISLFNNIQWSTSSVFSQTLRNAKKLQYSVHILSKRYDIDTISDLQKLLSDQKTPSLLKKRILPYA